MDFQKLIGEMTTREKICQLLQLTLNYFDPQVNVVATGIARKLSIKQEDIKNVGTSLGTTNAKDAINIQKRNMEENPHKIPIMFCGDVIHGFKTIYPVNLGLSCSFNLKLVEECASMAAKEASVSGLNVTYSPMIDIARDCRWGRVVETCGEDTYLTSKLAEAYIKGYQGNFGKYKIASCAKHFAGYGAAESGKDYNNVEIGERLFREIYLTPFKCATDIGVSMIMPSFNTVNGIPMTGNKKYLKDMLRDEWKFNGIVISDFAALREMETHGYSENQNEACKQAVDSTIDIEMMSTAMCEHYEELIKTGKVLEEQLNESVLRVLKLKEKLGLFDNPYKDANIGEENKILLCDEHRELAKQAAIESAVLLKNNDILPFDGKKIKKIAIIGPHGDSDNLNGAWCCAGRSKDTITVKSGIEKALPHAKIYCEKGCGDGYYENDYSHIKSAVKAAKKSDAVILCLGESGEDSGESKSKAHIDLPDVQYKLLEEVLKVNKNCVVLLFNGRPMSVTKLNDVAPAILDVWWPGTESGNAIAELLFGKSIPSGKLTMTFPRTVGQNPIYYNHYNTGRPRINDGNELFKSSYIDEKNSPLYPFGYGLSYTRFEYGEVYLSSNMLKRGEKIVASANVKNTGSYNAFEIVQLYITDKFGSVVRPVKELKGFEKIILKSGEEKVVSFTIDEKMLEYFINAKTKIAESGSFKVYIAPNSVFENYKEFILEY